MLLLICEFPNSCDFLQVLEVGCGNSRLGEELLREGVAGGVTCIDLSPVAVQRMRDRLAEQGTSGKLPIWLTRCYQWRRFECENLILFLQGVDVLVADVLDMPFQTESFDLVIEKSTMVRVLLYFDGSHYSNTSTFLCSTVIFPGNYMLNVNCHSKEQIH